MRNVLAGSVAVLAALAAVGCSSAGDDETKTAQNSDWSCERADVPMGEVTRCTSTTVRASTPAPATGGEGNVGLRTYGTPPPSDGSSSAPPASSSDDGSGEYQCTSSETNPQCPSGDKAPPPPATDDSPAGPDECTYAPDDLSYCQAPPDKKDNPPPPVWTCAPDDAGHEVCETQPTCSPGTHASKCGGCVEDGANDDCLPASEGGCWVTGGGFIVEPSIVPGAPADGNDNYGGNAKQMKQGGVSGHWNHVDHGTQNHAKGRPEYLFCRHVEEPGPGQPGGKKGLTSNQVYFGGPAEWNAGNGFETGYWFDVVAKDHGEPGSQPSAKNGGMVDTYHFTIRKMADPVAKVSGPVVYEVKGGLVGGNIQIHPSNNGHPGIQSPLPAWVGLEP